jgi:hypothetical protein
MMYDNTCLQQHDSDTTEHFELNKSYGENIGWVLCTVNTEKIRRPIWNIWLLKVRVTSRFSNMHKEEEYVNVDS